MNEQLGALRDFVKPWSLWLIASLVVIFLSAMLIGWGGYGGSLLAAMIVIPLLGVSWLALSLQAGLACFRALFPPGRNLRIATASAVLPFAAAALLCGLALPVIWLSGRVQSFGILFANILTYNDEIAVRKTKPLPERDAILTWPWGGSVDSDLDIVWDPLDDPAQRLSRKERGGEADCRHLLSHYYDCNIWY